MHACLAEQADTRYLSPMNGYSQVAGVFVYFGFGQDLASVFRHLNLHTLR